MKLLKSIYTICLFGLFISCGFSSDTESKRSQNQNENNSFSIDDQDAGISFSIDNQDAGIIDEIDKILDDGDFMKQFETIGNRFQCSGQATLRQITPEEGIQTCQTHRG